jgi:hypothetical protein
MRAAAFVIHLGVNFCLEFFVMNEFLVVISEEQFKGSEVLGTGRSALGPSMTNLMISIAAIQIFCFLVDQYVLVCC